LSKNLMQYPGIQRARPLGGRRQSEIGFRNFKNFHFIIFNNIRLESGRHWETLRKRHFENLIGNLSRRSLCVTKYAPKFSEKKTDCKLGDLI